MSAEDLPQLLVAALAEQVQVHLAECRQEAVRVGDRVHVERAVGTLVAHLESVVHEVDERHRDREQSSLQVPQREAVLPDQCDDLDGVRAVRPDHRVVAVFVGAQYGMRVVVLAGQQPVEVPPVRRQIRVVLLGLRHSSLPAQ